jgi:hypothetical protein
MRVYMKLFFTVSILVCKSLNCKTCQYSNNTFQKKPPLFERGRISGEGGESSVAKTWANSSTSLKIEFAPQMRPQILNPACAATGKGFRVAEQTNSMDYGNRLKSETLCQRLKSYYFPGGCKNKKFLNKKREPLLCQRHTKYTSTVLHIRYLV